MAEEEDFSNLPLPERFAHKNWKVRKEAYEAATTEFKTAQESDSIVHEFTRDAGLWKGAVADSNVAAQQEALAALCAFLDIAGTSGCTRTRNHTIPSIVEKGLTGRPAAKQSAQEALMLYIELDRSDPVMEELLPLLSHKQPKIIAATLSAITTIVHAYGCKTVEPKSIIKILPKAYGHADKNVRAEAQLLTVELYRWLKESMKPLFWNELKPVQQQDLEKMFEKVKDEPAPKQERLLRSQQAAVETPAASGLAEDAQEAGEEEEPEAETEPEIMSVDVFPKIPKDFSERLASSKWKDRKDALEELHAAVNVPAIEEGPFDEIVRGCAKSMKDANIAVVTVAANCVESIAKGLKSKFGRYRSTIFAPMLERFKEKKQSVTDALAAASDAVFASTGLSDVLEELLEFFKHKNPQVKLESTRFLIRALKSTKDVPQLPEVKSLAEAAKVLLADSQETQRTAAAEVLGVLWKIMGDRNMLMYLEGLDDTRKNRIKEFCDQAEVRAKWKPKAAPPPKPAAAAPTQKKAPLGKRPTTGVKKAAPVQRPISPLEESAPPTPLAARPTSRPGSKVASSRSGLQAPKTPGLTRPGVKTLASPKRQTMLDDSEPAITQSRGLAAPGRGLAGRPLGKAADSMAMAQAPVFAQAPASTLSSAERAELSDLRAETELLRQQNSDLRTDKLRLQSQISELHNQENQMIEENNRDKLQIKAKEAQLVRARSEVGEAEDRIASLERETERLKREVQRLGRSALNDNGVDGTAAASNGTHSRYDGPASGYARPGYGSKNHTTPTSLSNLAYRSAAAASADEGKENIPEQRGGMHEKRLNPAASARPSPMPIEEQVGASGGRASPSSVQSQATLVGSGIASSRGSSLNRSQSDGVESWRRAAEVTQNLKARIEMMKAKQNLTRGH